MRSFHLPNVDWFLTLWNERRSHTIFVGSVCMSYQFVIFCLLFLLTCFQFLKSSEEWNYCVSISIASCRCPRSFHSPNAFKFQFCSMYNNKLVKQKKCLQSWNKLHLMSVADKGNKVVFCIPNFSEHCRFFVVGHFMNNGVWFFHDSNFWWVKL